MRYRVRRGYTFGQFDQHPAGTLVELSEYEARGFLDKLEPVPEAAPAVSEAAALAPEEARTVKKRK